MPIFSTYLAQTRTKCVVCQFVAATCPSGPPKRRERDENQRRRYVLDTNVGILIEPNTGGVHSMCFVTLSKLITRPYGWTRRRPLFDWLPADRSPFAAWDRTSFVRRFLFVVFTHSNYDYMIIYYFFPGNLTHIHYSFAKSTIRSYYYYVYIFINVTESSHQSIRTTVSDTQLGAY